MNTNLSSLIKQIEDQDARMLALVSQEEHTERDVFIAREICNQRIRTLEKMEREVNVKPIEHIIRVDGVTIKFPGDDSLFTFLAGLKERDG